MERLNSRQQVDYQNHREEFIQWMLTLGKNSEQAIGYATSTTDRRAHGADKFYRWVWDKRNYTLEVTHEDADDYCLELAQSDTSDSHKTNTQKALRTLFRWKGNEWDSQINFTESSTMMAPREYLTEQERKKIREASLEHGTVPSPGHLDSEERTEWKKHLAVRFRKPANDVSYEDFRQANGFEIPSLIYLSLDAGLRPSEVGEARISWFDSENGVFRVPSDGSVKNRDYWYVALSSRTVDMVSQWLEERKLYDKYHESDRLWLTREGEPHSSRTLGYLIEKLCDVAEIDTEHRDMSWYAIRHSTGTLMANERGLKAAAAQLRRKTLPTRYDQAPVEDRQDVLNETG